MPTESSIESAIASSVRRSCGSHVEMALDATGTYLCARAMHMRMLGVRMPLHMHACACACTGVRARARGVSHGSGEAGLTGVGLGRPVPPQSNQEQRRQYSPPRTASTRESSASVACSGECTAAYPR